MGKLKSPKLGTVNSRLVGAAAEHFVMCELLRRNYIAALAPIGAPDADIIVSDYLGSTLAVIQVKARRETEVKSGWHMKSKHETMIRNQLFYCFVQFKNDTSHSCWIMPSSVVADAIKRSHDIWLKTPGKDGKAHNPNDMRWLQPDYGLPEMSDRGAGWMDSYRDAWSMIGTPVSN